MRHERLIPPARSIHPVACSCRHCRAAEHRRPSRWRRLALEALPIVAILACAVLGHLACTDPLAPRSKYYVLALAMILSGSALVCAVRERR